MHKDTFMQYIDKHHKHWLGNRSLWLLGVFCVWGRSL